tara:strand:+ start:1749 stop:1946 length:198 start_codon:yes stop_codon:yes gene_type:complete
MMKLETISTYLDSSIRHGSPITEGFVREIKEVIDFHIEKEVKSKNAFKQVVNTLAEEKEKGLWKQ